MIPAPPFGSRSSQGRMTNCQLWIAKRNAVRAMVCDPMLRNLQSWNLPLFCRCLPLNPIFAIACLLGGFLEANAADPAPTVLEPSELARRPDLVGREIVVDDRIKYFLESKKGQGFDELILKRTDVPLRLPPRLRFARPPSEPNAVARGALKLVEGHLIFDVARLELLPNDSERLDRELGRLRPEDFASIRGRALWAERRGRELNDPKLEAKGVALEADALWVEANRPGADPIALADGSSDRPISKVLRDALYHRGFRALEAKASTANALDDLAKRIRAALPRSAEPGTAPGPKSAEDADPASTYRAAPDAERAAMDRRLYADLVEKSLVARLAEDPSKASALADEAAQTLPDRPSVGDKLRQRGLVEAERGVASMRQAEVEELAKTFREAGQDDRARRLFEEWLADRRKNRLSASDAEGRVLLAANYEKLLSDRATAGILLNEAATIEPESRAVADAFLRLGYRKGDSGWFDPTASKSSTPTAKVAPTRKSSTAEGGDSLQGLTQAQARSRMGGKPDRVVRSATQGNIIEQWIYRSGKTEQFILFRIEATTSEPRVTGSYSVDQ